MRELIFGQKTRALGGEKMKRSQVAIEGQAIAVERNKWPDLRFGDPDGNVFAPYEQPAKPCGLSGAGLPESSAVSARRFADDGWRLVARPGSSGLGSPRPPPLPARLKKPSCCAKQFKMV